MAKIKINTTALRELEANAVKALSMATDATLTDIISAQVIPFDVGTMQNDQTFADLVTAKQGKTRIATSAVQGPRLYLHPEYKFQTVNNPNAKAGWFDDWVSGAKSEFAKNAFVRFLKNLMGG